uniref:Uncharacterized protein n=1 Tax=Mucochytrium quahogii TaxID=96639 RepID=A0A7S2SEJ7_9STRA|mmetsp:Transcript_4745/g.10400  ORF Transcript_4745/g.10400 Transcript_4745/m.10400 type:complete len:799 (+) Transcript_4745:509-2905(+)
MKSRLLGSEIKLLEENAALNLCKGYCEDSKSGENAGSATIVQQRLLNSCFSKEKNALHAVGCLNIVSDLIDAQEFHPTIAVILRKVIELVKGDIFMDKGCTVLACSAVSQKHADCEGTRAEILKLQTRIGLLRSEYLQLTKTYENIETELQEVVDNFNRDSAADTRLERSLKLLTQDIEEEMDLHGGLLEKIKLEGLEANKRSETLYDVSSKRNILRTSICAMRQKISGLKGEHDSADGTVPKHVYDELLDEIAGLKSRISETEKGTKGKQSSFLEVIKLIKDTEEELVKRRVEYDELTAAEEAVLKTLTPRPSWEKIEYACDAIVGGLEGSYSTRLGTQKLAQYIIDNNLDGTVLLKKQNELLDAQKRLKETKSKLRCARAFLSGKTLEKSKLQDKDAVVAAGVRSAQLEQEEEAAAAFWASGSTEKEAVPQDPKSTGFASIGLILLRMKYEKVRGGKKDEVATTALGRGGKIPTFLRTDGNLRLRPIPRPEMLELIRDVWGLKLAREKEQGQIVGLADAVHLLLKNRYGLQQVVAKWGYRLLYTLKRMLWDPDMGMFQLCLSKRVPEGTYLDQRAMVFALRNVLSKLSVVESGGTLGEVTKGSLRETLKSFFPTKSEDHMNALEEAINLEQPLDSVFIDILLDEEITEDTSDETEMNFINLVKSQHVDGIRDLYKALQERLVFVSTKTSGDRLKCKIGDITGSLKKVDPLLSQESLCYYLKNGLPKSISSEADAQLVIEGTLEVGDIDVKDFLDNLHHHVYKPTLNFDPITEPVLSTAYHNQLNQMRAFVQLGKNK